MKFIMLLKNHISISLYIAAVHLAVWRSVWWLFVYE